MTSTVFAWDTDVMPRRPPKDEAGPDEWAAWRVGLERERRGLSQGQLARLVTDMGAPMQQQAIWKIENGRPPRKISYGEAVAFCKVFAIDDVAELGQPPEEVALAYMTGIRHLLRDWRRDTDELIEQLGDLRDHADPEVLQRVLDDLRYWLTRIERAVGEVKSMLGTESAGSET
jgi:hypothetical protein